MSVTEGTLSSQLQRALSFAGPISPHELEVYDEHEAEKDASSPASWAVIASPDGEDDAEGPDFASTLSDASRGVKDTTHKEYTRLSEGFGRWCKNGGFIPSNVDVFGEIAVENMPQLICLWILQAADNVNPDGTHKPWSEKRVSYSYAMRMRAALTYKFGRLSTRGNLEWTMGEDGKWKGNPSLSLQVSRYMVSLRRRKAQDGETTMSSRAITTSVLRDLHLINSRTEHWEIGASPTAAATLGPRARRLLQAAYIVAFLCLLRFDEVLAIKIDDLRILDNGNAIELTLPHRKTAQYGGIKPCRVYNGTGMLVAK
ncbi:hypothetical protein LXA43DRAFT_1103924 [Ganoderma leucocontextum]|nr:hypothetical protein LXA43DRAFT_1103924 [Ganoderma leucocontextum]